MSHHKASDRRMGYKGWCYVLCGLTILFFVFWISSPENLSFKWDENVAIDLKNDFVKVNFSVDKQEVHTSVYTRQRTPSKSMGKEILFLHGQVFSSQVWEDTGALTFLAEHGFRSVAVDLPGHGLSEPLQILKDDKSRASFLLALIKALRMQQTVLVSPSMSGMYSLPFLMEYSQYLSAFIPIAPAYTEYYSTVAYKSVQTRTLIAYGDADTGLGEESLKHLMLLPNHEIFKIPQAKHAAYVDQPILFQEKISTFLSSSP
uniref:protein ABHD14A-like n=1 Tax=Myxine glutinosa TaxID=7769 RepID=UPI00359018D2